MIYDRYITYSIKKEYSVNNIKPYSNIYLKAERSCNFAVFAKYWQINWHKSNYLIRWTQGWDKTAHLHRLGSLGHLQLWHLLQRIQVYNIGFSELIICENYEHKSFCILLSTKFLSMKVVIFAMESFFFLKIGNLSMVKL